jgi:hypothetical protein
LLEVVAVCFHEKAMTLAAIRSNNQRLVIV